MSMDLIDLQRDLRRKIDKAKKIMQLVDSGDLKVLSDKEQQMIDLYPKWVQDLEEVKQGRVPQPRGAAQGGVTAGGAATAAAGDRSGASRVQAPIEEATGSLEEDLDEDEEYSRAATLALSTATAKARKTYIESFVASKVSLKELNSAAKQFDDVSELRRDILNGTIPNPSKGQLRKIATYEEVKKRLQFQKETVRSQQDAVRSRLLETIEIIEAEADCEEETEDEAEGEEVVGEGELEAGVVCLPGVEGVAATEDCTADASVRSIGGSYVEAKDIGSPVDEEVNDIPQSPVAEVEATIRRAAAEASQQATVTDKAEDEDDVDEEEEEEPAVEGDDEDDMFGFGAVFSVAKQKKLAKEVQAAKAASTIPQVADEAAPVAQPDAAAEAEEISQPTCDVVTAAPKEIDWSELKYKKFRPKLTFTAPVAAPPVAAPPTASPGESTAPEAVPAAGGAPAPLDFLTLEINDDKPAYTVAKKQPAAAAPKGKKGPTAKAIEMMSPVTNQLAVAAQQRVQRDLIHCYKNPLVNVRVSPLGDDILTWCVNVAPFDGPLSGVIVPLRMKFSDMYPMVPPVLYSLVDIPHPNVITAGSQRHALCMEHTGASTWEPSCGAHSILRQLQNFFSDEAFERAKKALQQYSTKIKFARQDCSRFEAQDGSNHSPSFPSPALPLINGPFASSSSIKVFGGAIHGPGQFQWKHCYARSGSHRFRVKAQFGGGAVDGEVVLLFSTSSTTEATSNSIVVDLKTGAVSTNKVASGDPLPRAVLDSLDLDFLVDFSKRKVSVLANGSECLVQIAFPDEESSCVRPVFSLRTKNAAVTTMFSVTSRSIWRWSESAVGEAPLAIAATDGFAPLTFDENEPHCFVSLSNARESILGVHVEVLARSKSNYFPTELRCSVGEFISVKAFEQLRARHQAFGRTFDGMIPLCFESTQVEKSISELKRQLTRLARNPSASVLYEPPFKAASAVAILPIAMTDTARFAVRSAMKGQVSDVVASARLYMMLLRSFALLVTSNDEVRKEAINSATLAERSATTLLALSHFLDTPWPEVVRSALRIEFQGTDETAFKKLSKSKRQILLGSAALAKATRTTTVNRLLEELSSNDGMGPKEMVDGIVRVFTIDIPKVNSWESMEEFLGVEVSE